MRKTHGQAEQAYATAAFKRAEVGDAQHENAMDAQTYSRDTLMQALDIAHKYQQLEADKEQAAREHVLAQQQAQQPPAA